MGATFIKEAIQIAARLRDEKSILHIRLGGSVTFNPLYQKNGLKGGSFVETAFMLKSAAANFMGGAGHHAHAIWDVLASNLLKNCLIYCATKFEYFTLKDLYKAVILETIKNVHETKRILSQDQKKYLFVVWQKTECCRDLTDIASSQAILLSTKASCLGEGGL